VGKCGYWIFSMFCPLNEIGLLGADGDRTSFTRIAGGL